MAGDPEDLRNVSTEVLVAAIYARRSTLTSEERLKFIELITDRIEHDPHADIATLREVIGDLAKQ